MHKRYIRECHGNIPDWNFQLLLISCFHFLSDTPIFTVYDGEKFVGESTIEYNRLVICHPKQSNFNGRIYPDNFSSYLEQLVVQQYNLHVPTINFVGMLLSKFDGIEAFD